jgi:hypothetical protein
MANSTSRWQAAQARCPLSARPEVVLEAPAAAEARHRVQEARLLHPLQADPVGRHLHLPRAERPLRPAQDLEGLR